MGMWAMIGRLIVIHIPFAASYSPSDFKHNKSLKHYAGARRLLAD